jgi:hypothetical protein
MNHAVIVLVVVGIAVIVAGIGYFYSHQRRSRMLREHFGPEYDRVLRQEKSVRRAEGVLEFREKAREAFAFVRSPVRTRPLTLKGGMLSSANSWMLPPNRCSRRTSWSTRSWKRAAIR